MVHISIWSVAGLTSTRTVGSSACNRARPCTSLSSSLDERAEMATGSSGSGIVQGDSTAGSAGSDRVSPVSAWASRATATMSPATARGMRTERGAQRPGDRPGAFVEIVLGVPGLVLRMTGEAGEVAADMHRNVGQQGAGEHPHHRDPTDVGVGRGLHHLGDQRPVRAAGQRFSGRTGRGVDGRQDMFDGHREAPADHLEQLGDAESGGRYAGQHGVEGAAGDRGLQVVDDGVEADLLAAEVAVQQAVVLGLGDHAPRSARPAGRRWRRPRPRRRVGRPGSPLLVSKTVWESRPISAVGASPASGSTGR